MLYRERIFEPLRLRHTAYDPQGPIAGAHAKGYALGAKDALTDTTAWHFGKGADGAIVTHATDEARFLTALTDGTLLGPSVLGELGAGDPGGCGGPFVHRGSGAGDGYKSDLLYAVDDSRVAVLLLNGAPARRDRVRARRGHGRQPLLRRLTHPAPTGGAPASRCGPTREERVDRGSAP